MAWAWCSGASNTIKPRGPKARTAPSQANLAEHDKERGTRPLADGMLV